ncbi:hrp65 protein-like isoform X1 [Diorhabda sublineata]|uniref:hrp65 protein-like isoform X1 n=1 Tax=Diorhabda sublineata TaxID=1163346 RepID=UPI0024E0C0DE|nr:hrp65 protein-like isoform X1 [Diorhabda sublineata]
MDPESKPDTTNIKVESSTNDTTLVVPENTNNFNRQERRGGGGGSGERFGRGGRFGGPRGGGGGSGQNQREGRNYDNRRGRGGNYSGGFGGGRNMKNDEDGGENQEDGGHQGGRGHDRHDRNDRDGGMRGMRGPRGGMRGPEDKFLDRVLQISGPTFDLPPIEMAEKKFNGRNRLYIGNIGSEVTEEELLELFKPYGETAEVFVNKEKNFGFIKLDYHSNAEKAKRELDGTVVKSRNLKIRFAPNSASIKVKNLTPHVTNELLHYAFSIFGEIERAIVSVDERGKPTGEGVIDFSRKGSALHAIRKCTDGCFFITGSLRPVIVELFDIVDDINGYPEKNVNKKHPEFMKEREQGPRFAATGSFENEYGMRWKQLYDLHAQKEEALKKELELEKEKLIAQMEYARYEHETEMLRDQLRAREMDKDRQKREWEMKQRQVEEERLRTEEQMRKSQENMESRIMAQQEELRRRQQENNLFMQAHNLDSILNQQEQVYEAPSGYSQNIQDDNGITDPKTFMSSYERHGGNRYERDSSRTNQGGVNNNRGSGHWVNDSRRGDDFPNKRRRF